MAVTITSSNPVQLVSGIGVRLDAQPAPAITTDDIYDPINPALTLTKLIGNVSSVQMVGSGIVDGTTGGNYPMFTVPAGHTFIPTQIIFALIGIAGSGDSPTVSVGFTASFQQLISSGRVPDLLTNLNQLHGVVPIVDFSVTAGHSGADLKYLNGGEVLTVSVDEAATYSTYLLKCFVFGLLTGNLPLAALPTSKFGQGFYGRDLYGEA